jgi:hypothetical protein
MGSTSDINELIQGFSDPARTREDVDAYEDSLSVLKFQIQSMAEFADLSFKFFAVERYRKLGEELLSAIGLDITKQKIVVTDEVVKIYQEAYRRYYLPFMEQKPYVMQRFLADRVFVTWFKSDQPIFKQYTKLVLLYTELRFLLVCFAAARQRLDDEMLVLLTSQVIRNFVNAKTVMKMKMSRLEKTGKLSMEHLAKLIKVEP